jgi:hypothetical protein
MLCDLYCLVDVTGTSYLAGAPNFAVQSTRPGSYSWDLAVQLIPVSPCNLACWHLLCYALQHDKHDRDAV